MKNYLTKIQINALIALGVTAGIAWRISDLLLVNQITDSQFQLLAGMLAGCVASVCWIAKHFAGDNDDEPR